MTDSSLKKISTKSNVKKISKKKPSTWANNNENLAGLK